MPEHLVNVAYLEDFFSGRIKAPVELVATSDVGGTYAGAPDLTITGDSPPNDPLEIDGVEPTVGQRVLLTGQTAGSENGIYVVTQQGDSSTVPFILTRSNDFNSADNILPGVSVQVNAGDNNANTNWRLTTQSPIVLDTSTLDWVSVTPATGAKKYAEQIDGDDTTDSFTITHNLATSDITVQIWNVGTKAIVLTDIEYTDDNNIEVSFAEPPPTGTDYNVVVIG